MLLCVSNNAVVIPWRIRTSNHNTIARKPVCLFRLLEHRIRVFQAGKFPQESDSWLHKELFKILESLKLHLLNIKRIVVQQCIILSYQQAFLINKPQGCLDFLLFCRSLCMETYGFRSGAVLKHSPFLKLTLVPSSASSKLTALIDSTWSFEWSSGKWCYHLKLITLSISYHFTRLHCIEDLLRAQ